MGICQKRASQAAEQAAEPPKEVPPLPIAPIYDSEGWPLWRLCDADVTPFEGGQEAPRHLPR